VTSESFGEFPTDPSLVVVIKAVREGTERLTTDERILYDDYASTVLRALSRTQWKGTEEGLKAHTEPDRWRVVKERLEAIKERVESWERLSPEDRSLDDYWTPKQLLEFHPWLDDAASRGEER
jgi:hypothetical protein